MCFNWAAFKLTTLEPSLFTHLQQLPYGRGQKTNKSTSTHCRVCPCALCTVSAKANCMGYRVRHANDFYFCGLQSPIPSWVLAIPIVAVIAMFFLGHIKLKSFLKIHNTIQYFLQYMCLQEQFLNKMVISFFLFSGYPLLTNTLLRVASNWISCAEN